MQWLPVALASLPPAPAEGSASPDLVTAAVQQILGFGVLGIVALVLAWIVYRGSFVPQKRADEMVAAGRADLLRELESRAADIARVTAEKDKAEAELAEALRFARDDIVPLLTTFNATVSALLPILQQLVYRAQEDTAPARRQRREPH